MPRRRSGTRTTSFVADRYPPGKPVQPRGITHPHRPWRPAEPHIASANPAHSTTPETSPLACRGARRHSAGRTWHAQTPLTCKYSSRARHRQMTGEGIRHGSAPASTGCRLFSDCIRRQSEHKRKALKRSRVSGADFRRLVHEEVLKDYRLAVASSQHHGRLEKAPLKFLYQRNADYLSLGCKPVP